MHISSRMQDALNEQIGHELSSSVQYLAIAAHFDGESLPELARHFYRQSDEERGHALRFVKFMIEAGAKVQIPAVPQPPSSFPAAEAAVQQSVDGECDITRQINALVDLAIKESDHITRTFLQWFLTEQLEEVSSAENLLRIVQRAGEQGLLHVEDYLARHNLAGTNDAAAHHERRAE